jgi:adenine-specific DNA methylase
MKRAIEESFPIVDINRLAVPERNAFKPIYQMHKSFAPRASCVFRAILLGALKPAQKEDGTATQIMEEFYKDHTNDPDTNGKVILDPFMGGGTTVVEALRMGCEVIGIDLNPVAWLVVKNAVEPIDLDKLDAAFDRLANRIVHWSGKTVKDTLLDLYKTEAPWVLASDGIQAPRDSDTLYTFWVKSAICTSATCKKQVPLHTDYIVAQKRPSIYFWPDCICPSCEERFDWEIEPAALIADPNLMIHSSTFSAGGDRTSTRWTYVHPQGGLYLCQGSPSNGQAKVKWGELSAGEVKCPHCAAQVKPKLTVKKRKRKKIPLHVILCPLSGTVFQWRGELHEDQEIVSPTGFRFNPHKGSVPKDGWFQCSCGTSDKNIESIRTLPEESLLPIAPYALEAYSPECDPANELEEDEDEIGDFFGGATEDSDARKAGPIDSTIPKTHNLIWKNKGKFFKNVSASDYAMLKTISETRLSKAPDLRFPTSTIPNGAETGRLLEHHYRFWCQMFNPRQLLSLSTLLEAIKEEENEKYQELMLTFSAALERNNMFCRYYDGRNTIQANFDRHDFAPKIDPAENTVWGYRRIRGTFPNMFGRLREGAEFQTNVYDWDITRLDTNDRVFWSKETVLGKKFELHSDDAREIIGSDSRLVDAVITDPPYAGNVNYSELYDFFYVWQRLLLKEKYPAFAPEYTPKAKEIIENRTRALSNENFREGLQHVFTLAHSRLKNDGIMVFTYHHSKPEQWVDLCDAVCLAGFVIDSVFPVHGDKESALNLQDTEGLSYDLIHVCRKRDSVPITRRPWASLRLEIRQKARQEARLVEAGRYGKEKLRTEDARLLLTGKCLELYSKHYGSIVDHEDKVVSLADALREIRFMVEQIIEGEHALPSELSGIDIPSYIYFTTLCTHKEISRDSVTKSTHGIFETGELRTKGLIVMGRAQRGRTFEVKQPSERLDVLKRKFLLEWVPEQLGLFGDDNAPILPKDFLFVDCVHLLLGLAETGENLLPWLERFRGLRPQIRAALEYLSHRNPSFEKSAKIILGLMDERALFAMQTKNPTTTGGNENGQ